MSQSNVVAVFLIAAFLFYVAARGDLPVYLGFLLG